MPKETQVKSPSLPVLIKLHDGYISQVGHWNKLPKEVKQLIFQRLPLLSAEGVCLRTVSKDWKNNINLTIAQIPSQNILALMVELSWDNIRLLINFINLVLANDKRWISDNPWDIALNTYCTQNINQIDKLKLRQAIKELEQEIAKVKNSESSHSNVTKLSKLLERTIYSMKKTLSVLEHSYPQPLEIIVPDEITSQHSNYYINLRGANLSHAYLRCANFTGANLESANFSFTNLAGAIFLDTYLVSANFFSADLSSAIFATRSLKNVSFENAILTRTDFKYASREGAIFAKEDESKVVRCSVN